MGVLSIHSAFALVIPGGNGGGLSFTDNASCGLSTTCRNYYIPGMSLSTHGYFSPTPISLTGAQTHVGLGDIVLANDKLIHWVYTDGVTANQIYIGTLESNALALGTIANSYVGLFYGDTLKMYFFENHGGATIIFNSESTSCDDPGANHACLFLKDNGSGKAILYVQFHTGAAQQIAAEP